MPTIILSQFIEKSKGLGYTLCMIVHNKQAFLNHSKLDKNYYAKTKQPLKKLPKKRIPPLKKK